MVATNKRLLISESHDDSNRCTSYRRKPPTNTSRMFFTLVHAHLAYAFCGQSPYVTTFHWLPRSRNRPLHPEGVLATKYRLPQPSSLVTSFLLPCDSLGVGEREVSTQWLHSYISLLGSYHQHATGRSILVHGGQLNNP
jgi:hypothetical protein